MDPRNVAAASYAPPYGAPQYQQLLGALHQMQSAPTVPMAPAAPPRDTLTLSQGQPAPGAVNPALIPYVQNGTMSRLTEMLHQLMTAQAPVPPQPAQPWNNPNYPTPPVAPATPPTQAQPAAPAAPEPPAAPKQPEQQKPAAPAAPEPPPAPKEPENRTYTVRSGDSLSKIAQQELGHANRWREIYDLNRDQLNDPNRIFAGQVLKLPKASQAPAQPTPKPEPKPEKGSGPVLQESAQGEPVRRLQERLKELGYDPGGVDGDMGPKTIAAVKRFQQHEGLEADGVVGPKTWAKLGIQVEGKVTFPKAPGGGNSDRKIDIGGPQLAVVRQGKYIGANLADKFDAMVAAAARDGVQLVISSGYRSHAEQEALWRANPDPRYVARPGTSNHEKGNAIDFKNLPGAYAWLKRNAARFGLHNYPVEPWHYSLDGR